MGQADPQAKDDYDRGRNMANFHLLKDDFPTGQLSPD
jgi:hypothetical protein